MELASTLSDQRVTIPSGLHLPKDSTSFYWALETLAKDHHCFGIYLLGQGQLVGMICCDPVIKEGKLQPHQFEISYLLDHKWWGQHIMTKALKKFCQEFQPDDHQLSLRAATLLTNVGSQKVLERVSFTRDNCSHQGIISWRWDRSGGQSSELADSRKPRV